jgi:hypothetical protein
VIGVNEDGVLEAREPVGKKESEEEFPEKKCNGKVYTLELNKVEDVLALVVSDSEQLSEVEGLGVNDEEAGLTEPEVVRVDPGIVTALADEAVEGTGDTVSVRVDEVVKSV